MNDTTKQAIATLEKLERETELLIKEIGIEERALQVKAICRSDNKMYPKAGFRHIAFQIRCWNEEVIAENYSISITVILRRGHSAEDIKFINEALSKRGFEACGNEPFMILLNEKQQAEAECSVYYYERVLHKDSELLKSFKYNI